MMFGMFVQGFWYGSSLARAGKLSSGEVIRTFWACTTAAQSIEQVLPQMIVMEKGKIAGAILRAIMNECGKNRGESELQGSQYPRYCEGDIEVNNVKFPNEISNSWTSRSSNALDRYHSRIPHSLTDMF